MCRGMPGPLAIAMLGITVGLAGLAGGWPAGRGRVLAQGPAPSPCTLTPDKVAAPARLPLGYAVDVTLGLRVACPETISGPLNVALVLDNSLSMAGPRVMDLGLAAGRLITALDLPHHPERQVAVIGYGATPTTFCPLGNDLATLKSCLKGLMNSAGGGAAIDPALRQGLRVLANGRPAGVPVADEAIILFTDGQNAAGCEPLERSAESVRKLGMQLFTIALAPDADTGCMARLPAARSMAYAPRSSGQLVGVFASIWGHLSGGMTVGLVSDTLPRDMVPILDSAVPLPRQAGGDPFTLEWDLAPDWVGVYTFTLKVVPQALGRRPTNLAAEALVVDGGGRVARASFPLPQVEVLDASGLPTPTAYPTRVWPTATATFLSPTPGPTRTPVPAKASPTPLPPSGARRCASLAGRVPDAAVAAALANPATVGGWRAPCRPGQPPGPGNPERIWLGMQDLGKPYHPLFNGLVYKCGCP